MTTAAHAEAFSLSALGTAASLERIEIRTLWNGLCRDVVEKEVGSQRVLFYVGEDPTCDAHLPPDVLGGASKLALIQADEGCVRIAGLGSCALANLHSAPVAVALGAFTFEIRAVDKTESFHAPLDIDWRTQSLWGVSLALHLVFFGLISLMPPEAAGFSFDDMLQSNRMAAIMILPPEAPTQRPIDQRQVSPEDGGDVAPKAAGDETQAGDRTKAPTHHRYALKQNDPNRPLSLRREVTKEMVSNAGILGIMNAAPAMSSPFGALMENGRDPENVIAALTGDQIGTNFGYGGLGVRGVGRMPGGGGHCPECLGLVGSGQDVIGNALKKGKNGRPGYDGPALSQKKDAQLITSGKVEVLNGSLSKDLIARVVRRHKPEIQHCYEKGLMRNASLSGRIAIRFMIGLSGAVAKSLVAESSLGDAQTEQCIAAVFRRMIFPKTEGLVFATYPFNLTSAGD